LDLLVCCSNAAVEVEKLDKLDAFSASPDRWPYGEGLLGV